MLFMWQESCAIFVSVWELTRPCLPGTFTMPMLKLFVMTCTGCLLKQDSPESLGRVLETNYPKYKHMLGKEKCETMLFQTML